MEIGSCGNEEFWKLGIVEDGNCGNWKVWKIGNCGNWELWKLKIVELNIVEIENEEFENCGN